MVRDTVRSFVEAEVLPIIEEHNQAMTFPQALIPKIGALGLLGATLPDKYGCAGMVTTAKSTSNGYVLNGAKMWITNGTIADVAVVWAKLIPPPKEGGGEGVFNDAKTIRGFLVEKGMKGFTAPEMKGKYSLRASVTSELVFQDVELPKENLLPGVQGLKGPLSCLTQARYGIAWGAIGAAMACYESSVNYAKSRVQFGRPIGGFQLVQEKLAFMLTEITKAQLLVHRLGTLKNEGTMRPQQVSLAKRNNVDIAMQIARTARDIHGANGILGEYPIMRHMTNLESVRTYEGTHDIHTLVLGEDITGIAAYQ